MGWKIDPFSLSLVFVGSSSSVSKKEIIKSLLIESNENLDLPKAEFVFDHDSVLYHDDEGLC